MRWYMLPAFLLGVIVGLCNADDLRLPLKPPAEPGTTAGKPYWIMFTAKWCGPCQRWKANEKPIMERAGYAVTVIDIDHDPHADKWKRKYGVSTVPTFFLLDRQTRKTLIGPVVGAKSAILMIRDVNRWGVFPPKVDAVTTRRTCAEIRTLVSSRYKQGQRLSADVAPQSRVWQHLTDGSAGTHTFAPEQVSCLELWEALSRHDDAHGSRTITPHLER